MKLRSKLARDLALAIMLASGCSDAHDGARHEDAPPEQDTPEGTVRFVAVGESGTILSSVDGIRWARQSADVTVRLNSVAASRSGFVIVGEGGLLLTSADGLSWAEQQVDTDADLTHVVFAEGKFVAVGGDWSTGAVTLSSHDGVAFSELDSPDNYMFRAVAVQRVDEPFGAQRLLASATYRSDLGTPALLASGATTSSAGGSGWSEREGPDFEDSVTLSAGLVVLGRAGVFTSEDALAWTRAELPGAGRMWGIAQAAWERGAGIAELIWAVGDEGQIFFAPPYFPAKWTQCAGAEGLPALRAIAHDQIGTAVAVGDEGSITTSSDGYAWTPLPPIVSENLVDIAARLRY